LHDSLVEQPEPVRPEMMEAREAAEIAGGGRLWVFLGNRHGGGYERCLVRILGTSGLRTAPVVLFDAGWRGSLELEPGELVKVDTGRIA
jgi:hypothetical protein